MKKMKADFYYELEDTDLIDYSKLDSFEKLLWLESIFELTVKAETAMDYKIRQFFREDRN